MITFKAFQNLYIGLKKIDIKLFTTIDTICNYLQQIINIVNFSAYASAYNSTTIIVPNSVFTVLLFDIIIKDNQGMYNLGTGSFIAKKEGWYIAHGQLTFNSVIAGNFRILEIIINGSIPYNTSRSSGPIVGNTVFIQGCYPAYLRVGDFVQFRAFQDSGGNLNAVDCWGSLTYIGGP